MGNNNSKKGASASSSSNSKSNSNSNNRNTNNGAVKNQATEEQKVDNPGEDKTQSVKEEIESQNAKRKSLLASVDRMEKAMNEPNGMPDVIDNYAKLRTCSKPNLFCIGTCIDQMKDGWESIMKQVDTIRKFSDKGKEKADSMTALYTDYWGLLLKTKVSIGRLLTQCAIQKENIGDLLEIIEMAHAGKLGDDEKVAYDDCISGLGLWIKAGIIGSLIGDWKRISARLQTEGDDWKELATAAAAYAARHTWKFIGKLVLGTLIVIGVIAAVAAIIIVTAGTAAVAGGAVAAGVAAAEVATVASVGVATGVVIGIAAAVGGVVALGSAAYGIKKGMDYKREAVKLQSSVNSIIERLENMLKASKSMENALTNFQISENDVGERLSYLENDESVYKMKKGLKRLLVCLDEYIRQGEQVNVAIENAVQACLK